MKVALHIGQIQRDGSEFHVHGRCIHGPLRLGDRFDCVYSVSLQPDYSTQEKLITEDIDLVVSALSTYGKVMDTIDEGLTLIATVVGSGIDQLKVVHYIGSR